MTEPVCTCGAVHHVGAGFITDHERWVAWNEKRAAKSRGRKHSPEARAKIAAAVRASHAKRRGGVTRPPAHVKSDAAGRQPRQMSDAHRIAIAKSQKKRKDEETKRVADEKLKRAPKGTRCQWATHYYGGGVNDDGLHAASGGRVTSRCGAQVTWLPWREDIPALCETHRPMASPGYVTAADRRTPVVVRCSKCNWSETALTADAAEAFKTHNCNDKEMAA